MPITMSSVNQAKLAAAVKCFMDNFASKNMRISRIDKVYPNKGKSTVTVNVDSPNYLLDYALYAAWKPAISAQKTRKSAFMNHKDSLRMTVKDAIVKGEFDASNFDATHKKICMLGFDKGVGERYGVVQKYINMVFKYLYCFKDIVEKKYSIDFDKCHCPVDSLISLSIVRNFKSEINGNDDRKYLPAYNYPKGMPAQERVRCRQTMRGYKSRLTAWSNFDQYKYQHIKDLILQLCISHSIPCGLVFDFLYW